MKMASIISGAVSLLLLVAISEGKHMHGLRRVLSIVFLNDKHMQATYGFFSVVKRCRIRMVKYWSGDLLERFSQPCIGDRW